MTNSHPSEPSSLQSNPGPQKLALRLKAQHLIRGECFWRYGGKCPLCEVDIFDHRTAMRAIDDVFMNALGGIPCMTCGGSGQHSDDCVVSRIAEEWTCSDCDELCDADSQPVGETFSPDELWHAGAIDDPKKRKCSFHQGQLENRIYRGLDGAL